MLLKFFKLFQAIALINEAAVVFTQFLTNAKNFLQCIKGYHEHLGVVNVKHTADSINCSALNNRLHMNIGSACCNIANSPNCFFSYLPCCCFGHLSNLSHTTMLAKNGANLILCSCSYVAKYPTCFLAVSNRNVQIREMYEICIVDTFDKLLAAANCNLPNDSSFMIEQELHLMQQV